MKNKNTILALGKKGVGKTTFIKNTASDYESHVNELFLAWENATTRIIVPAKELNQHNISACIKKLKKYNAWQPIQLLLFFIDLPSLVDSMKREEAEHFIDAQLKLLRKFQTNIPTAIIVTQCDQLLGFQEYFSDLNAEERQEPFGVKNRLEAEFLLKHIAQKTITRLHQEPLQEKRNFIQLFPAQFEKITEYAAPFLAKSDRLYFTSQKQTVTVMDVLTQSTVNTQPVIAEKVFFTKKLLEELQSFAEKAKKNVQHIDKKRWIAVPVCLVILTGLLVLWHKGFQDTSQVIRQTQLELQQNPPQAGKDPFWLAQLNLLSDSIQRLDTPNLNDIKFIGLNQVGILKKKLTLLYDTHLQTEFLPYVENQLTDVMRQNMGTDPVQLYNALKIYLMVTQRDHYDQNSVINWFILHWATQYPNDIALQNYLLNHLNKTLTLSTNSWPKNKMLIRDAQKILEQLPIAEAAFLKLQNNYNNARMPLSSLFDDTTHFDMAHIFIPTLYSTTYFKVIYNQQIPGIVSTLNQGDWVTGIVEYKKMTTQETNATITTVRALYLHHFSESWQNLIPTIQLKTPDNFADLQALIQEIIDPRSSFMNLLAFISGNALLSNTVTPSYALAQVDAYLHKKDVFSQTQNALKNISNYIKPIGDSDDINKASYNAAIAIINNPAAPNPIQAILSLNLGQGSALQVWLNAIAEDAWRITLANAKNYLNTMWVKLVMPDYNNNINHRYPIFKDGTDDATLADFTHFFEPNGTIDVFFNYYLKPFVDMSNSYWTWSSVYGQSIPIPQATLESLMRASLIQRMLFMDDTHKALFKFQLIPVNKSNDIDFIELAIEGQTLNFSSTQTDGNTFVWPGPQPEEVSVRVMYTQQAPYLQSFTGTWALFRLMQFATLIPTTNPQQYIMQVTAGTSTVTYHLMMDNKANPFLPGVIDQFRLPEEL